jgi:hypothetical protein
VRIPARCGTYRIAAKVDANHLEIVKALRQCGVTVQPLHTVGGGVPDLLCGYRGTGREVNVLLEIKDGALPPSAQALTAAQRDWHSKWSGQIAVVTNFDEAMDAILAAASTVKPQEPGEGL